MTETIIPGNELRNNSSDKHTSSEKNLPNDNENFTSDFHSKKISISDSILMIDIDKIEPDLEQPRKNFDPKTLNNLKESVKKNSLLDPILIRENPQKDGFYLIIDGERRWKVCKELNHTEIKSRIVSCTLEGYKIIALTKNIQRDDLLPIEKAIAFKALLERMQGSNENIKQKELIQIVNLSESFISEILSISTLDNDIKNEALNSKEWSHRKLLQLYKIKNPESRKRKFQEFKAIIAKKNNKDLESTKIDTKKYSNDSDTNSKPFKEPISLDKIRKRIDSFSRFIKKVSFEDLNDSEIEAIKKDLHRIMDSIA
jgi:ParB family chromosome partitioning protein